MKYLEDGWNKNEYVYYKSIISRWSVSFTKWTIAYEVLADSQH